MDQQSIETRPRVLFYGSLLPTETEKVKSLLNVFIPELLDQGCVIITREGSSTSKDGQVWLDNIVLDIAISHRTKEKLDYSSVISYVSVDDHDPSKHDRKMLRISGPGRLFLYRQLLVKCDAIVLIGGREGVYRISLFAYALKKLLIPFTLANGSAREVASEIAYEMTLLPESINILSSSVLSIKQSDCKKAVIDIKNEILNRRKMPSNQFNISDLDVANNEIDESISLRDLFKLISKMKVSVVAAIITTIIAIGAGCYNLGFFVSGLNKSTATKSTPAQTATMQKVVNPSKNNKNP
jgi:hypothetical protein